MPERKADTKKLALTAALQEEGRKKRHTWKVKSMRIGCTVGALKKIFKICAKLRKRRQKLQ
jgi:hypothetical protein